MYMLYLGCVVSASFLKNITSFIGDFSGFSNNTTPDDKCYLNSCDLYTVEDFTNRTLSYVITFKDEEVYHLLVTGIVILFDFDTESISVCNCFARFKKCSLNQYVHALPWMCSFKFDRCR
jgi:hypothetical protein